MFEFFYKKNKKSEPVTRGNNDYVDVSHLSDVKKQLFAQLKAKRQELGAEEIAKMQKALELDAIKKKMKSDIENDMNKRNRLLDEIRFNLKDK